jgi:hypothetical protein
MFLFICCLLHLFLRACQKRDDKESPLYLFSFLKCLKQTAHNGAIGRTIMPFEVIIQVPLLQPIIFQYTNPATEPSTIPMISNLFWKRNVFMNRKGLQKHWNER